MKVVVQTGIYKGCRITLPLGSQLLSYNIRSQTLKYVRSESEYSQEIEITYVAVGEELDSSFMFINETLDDWSKSYFAFWRPAISE